MLSLLLQPAFAQEGSFHPRQLTLRLKPGLAYSLSGGGDGIGLPAIDALNKKLSVAVVRQLVRSRPQGERRHRPDTKGLLLLEFERDTDIRGAVRLYLATGLVEYAEPNYIGRGGGVEGLAPNDQYYNRQWGLHNDGAFDAESLAGADISMEAAWELTQGSTGIIVAILDSGIRLNHPEFAGRFWFNTAEVTNNGQDDDLNGYTDDIVGWDFVNDDNAAADDHGHGTNVSGILAAAGDNGIGYAGIDWNCRVMPCKILDNENSGFYSWWTEAIYYAVDHGASVINMSVGGESFSSAMREAVDYAHANGVVVVTCMMNSNENRRFYPAAYVNTIAVGATGTNDERAVPFFWDPASGSNFGGHIDLVAPGSLIYGLDESSDTNFNSFFGGTSQAAPLVSGVVALIKGLSPALDVEAIRYILRNTADDQVGKPSEDLPGWDIYHGAGRLNAFRALEAVVNTVSVEDQQDAGLELTVYPNPGRAGEAGTLEVRVEQPQDAWLSVWDSLGKLWYSARIDLQPYTRFSLPAGLSPGMYWIELQKRDGGRASRKLVVFGSR